MAIRFKVNEDGERVAVVDTVRDFEHAIDTLDRPIIVPVEVARIYETAEVVDNAEWIAPSTRKMTAGPACREVSSRPHLVLPRSGAACGPVA